MTQAQSYPINFSPKLTTKSGKGITIGAGTGTKVKDLKRSSKTEDEIEKNSSIIVSGIKKAIEAGFNHIDTAEAYTTHPEVGRAIKEVDVPREDLFVVTKYNPPGNTFFKQISTGPHNFVDLALKELDVKYIDLLLLHHPFFKEDGTYTLESAWKELVDAKKQGKIRYLGGSNFAVEHLKTIAKVSEVESGGDPSFQPVVNQIEFHPYLQEQSPGIVEFSQQNNIIVEAYGPLTPLFRIKKDNKEIQDHPLAELLPKLTAKYNKTEAQILLRYTLQRNILPITTSSKDERIKQSLKIYDYELDQEDVDQIDKLGNSFKYRAFFNGRFD